MVHDHALARSICAPLPSPSPHMGVCKLLIYMCSVHHCVDFRLTDWTVCFFLPLRCPFRGTREQLHEHLKSCQFEQFKEILNEFEEKISKLQKQVKQKDEVS